MLTTVLLTLSSTAIGMNMTIIHANDTHSHLEETSTSLMLNGEKTYLRLGDVARMASKIKENKEYKPDSLVLHGRNNGEENKGRLRFYVFL